MIRRQREALIVAHGQPSVPVPPELWLQGFAAAVGHHLPDWKIRAATLAMPDALERQAAEMPLGSPIFPMFMADGWFVSKVLPKRLNGADLQILPPLGFHSALPDVAALGVRKALDSRGWRLEDSHLLLAAHGSARGPKAAESANAFAKLLQARLPGMQISTGFVEEAPFIADAARDLPAQSLCLPFFALEGEHCREDIPEALEDAAFSGHLMPPLGTWPEAAQMVAHAFGNVD
ncbi:CbiX/SirB N-terminal domain-containing protein [Shimia sp. R10_1]|uniref:CbiX/SirB N-terminal domain-containing protein n=1 Tax=Shimia sp. R10_1 TaxID=2821095 RepID=UPI001ADD374F|nr:CbiX/SirB N-terminal domain-containing protein [Shimia sp. R10_1]MBO9474332.1 CbiX/SirB N-terminal domain-containing protein [Shimia sp. R10_1]